MSRLAAAMFAVVALGPQGLAADHWRQTADPQVVMMMEQVNSIYHFHCQQGNPAACQALPMIQQLTQETLDASWFCVAEGNMNACQYYQNSAMQLSQVYMQLTQAGQSQMGAGSGFNPLGETHADRMNAIQQFGQQNMDNFNDRMRQMDLQHEQFMSTILQ
ncbi:MAG: hypothetical protein JJT81_04165 [Rubellimicrobium sp.]|nr:hypothetical protein [Rubellimicrobium sp.]